MLSGAGGKLRTQDLYLATNDFDEKEACTNKLQCRWRHRRNTTISSTPGRGEGGGVEECRIPGSRPATPTTVLLTFMGSVPYLQPLSGHEPPYATWSVLFVRPSTHPYVPVPLWAKGKRTQP